MYKLALILTVLVYFVAGRPQGGEQPEPYEYQYEVKDPEKELFFDKNEIGDAAGKVTGKYSVWLPDGRLMTVEYSVNGESGYVPKVSFDTTNPLG
ncbi:pro-resilin-like [Condylostylus longicornis]|uniref:pro-resilin-like n=1 Tax=Condylostylus longicornis TaxID=2530218 RepID=UPI00244E5358|nr:pro-resilin-like [Condylostylus longicornis]